MCRAKSIGRWYRSKSALRWFEKPRDLEQSRQYESQPDAVTACVVLLSGYLWYLNPERPWPYYLAMLVVFTAWTLRQFARGDGASRTSLAARRKFTQAIVSSGLLLAIALGGVLFAHMGWVVGFAR
jgi:hypothetical protein